ncbi:MAG: serine/threonine protein kinase [Deltaproteobacteria bacterium]|nr:serine/threonine protein kinase [Deltaproteobacteria bacterium]MCB9789122.1 serine/threonine protein kinase [Deltaproteobacteria bacterium]
MAPTNLPQKYGKYILLRKIAMGGMAEIFRAKTIGAEGFEKQIVIKRILPHFTDDEAFVKMFIDEASIASKLQHSNIVQIYDFDSQDDRYYIAMEYVEGADLKAIVERGLKSGRPMSPAQCVWIMMELSKGLHYAHTKEYNGQPLNIVHRDISPHNVIMSHSGEVKLMDFGIAKAAQRSTKTLAGTVKGKCAYMSPEQARGKALDGRSDLFALGIMLWEMLTHKRLFLGDSDFETLSNVLKADVPPPSSVNPEVPKELDAIVLKALAKDRDHRHASVEDFGRELTRWFYSNVQDLESVSLKPYLHEIFREDIERLRTEYTEERQMTIDVGSSPSTPAVSSAAAAAAAAPLPSDRTVALPGGDIQAAETLLDGALSQGQVERALAASRGQVSNDGATVALAVGGAQGPGTGTGTGSFQQGTGAFPQGHTGTFTGQTPQRTSPIAWILLAVLLVVVGGVGWVVFKMMDAQNNRPTTSAPPAREAAAAVAASAPAGNAVLELKVDPYSAKVTADGKPVDGKITGLAKGQKVALVAEAPGYERFEDTVTITEESQRETIKLKKEAQEVTVVVRTNAEGAKLFADGRELGADGKLKAEVGQEVEIEVQPPGGESVKRKVTIRDDQPLITIEVAGAAALAKLAVSVDPNDASVTADAGSLSRQGDSWVISGLRIGEKVTIEAKKSGYRDETKTIKVENANQAMILELKKAVAADSVPAGFGDIFINAKPWAKVSVDGTPKGTTPVTVKGVKSGRHTIVLSKGSETRTRSVTVKPDQRATVVEDFGGN